jgi:formate dehydrogenase alpha subunit
VKKVLTTCPYCGTGCGFYLALNDQNQVVAIEASSNHPVAANQLCVKGWNAFQFINHHERLTQPLIRKNDTLQPATWDEALNLVAEKMQATTKQHGTDALMFFSSAKTSNEENYLMMKLARAVFKTNNIDHCARLCHASTVTGLAETFGSGAMTNSIACMEKADCILVTGSNTTEQHPLIGTRIIKAARNGARLIVADNRTIRLARHANLHLRCKNGTDVAFLNSLMHVIIRDGLENKNFIATRTENYEQLKEIVASYTPEKVATICGIDAHDIIRAAHLFAQAKNSMIVYSMGITQHIHGVDNVKSCANLSMLTGQIGRPGTGVNPLRGQNNVQGACDMGALPNVFPGYQKVTETSVLEKFSKAWNVDNLNNKIGYTVTSALDAAHHGTLKTLYIMGENPMLSDPDQSHVGEALKNLDFLVVQDIFLTQTAALADVVLPATSFAEKDGTFTSTERRVQRIRQAINPIGSARADWEILCDLAKRLGSAQFNYAHPAAIMEEIASLTPSYAGINYTRIDQVGLCWPCPSIDHPGTPILHTEKFTRGLGKFSPVDYFAPAELPDEEYPFLLSTGRCYFHYHTGTMTRRTRLLEREERFPYVEINTEDAKKLKIRDRDWVLLETRRGSIKVMARVTTGIAENTLFTTFHFEEGAANALTINACDPVAQIPEFKVCAARLRRIEA